MPHKYQRIFGNFRGKISLLISTSNFNWIINSMNGNENQYDFKHRFLVELLGKSVVMASVAIRQIHTIKVSIVFKLEKWFALPKDLYNNHSSAIVMWFFFASNHWNWYNIESVVMVQHDKTNINTSWYISMEGCLRFSTTFPANCTCLIIQNAA